MKNPTTYGNLFLEFPAQIIRIDKMRIIEEFNEHGLAEIHLLACSENELRYISELSADTRIRVVIQGKSVSDDLDDNRLVKNEHDKHDDVIFVGLASNIEVIKTKQVHYSVTLTLRSTTYLLDYKRVWRSFQDKLNPYENLFKTVIKSNYPQSVIFDYASDGALQDEAIIQYNETNWQFMKRLASKLGVMLLANVRAEYPNICVGHFRGDTIKDETPAYEIQKENGSFLFANLNFGGLNEEDKVFVKIKSPSQYEASDTVIYEQLIFKVYKKETVLEKGLILFVYWLVKENGIQGLPIVNSYILGASIDGKVLDVRNDRVKIHLSIDETQSIDEAYWYKYETSYTSEGQTGFYSMPQIGDDVKLYTPTEYIDDAYVRTVNRLDGDANVKIQDPNVKYYGNIDKKELMLAPAELQVTSTNGMILINMDDNQGIEITSSVDIMIHTQDAARIQARSIGIRAMNEIRLATRHSGISVAGIIQLEADGGVNL